MGVNVEVGTSTIIGPEGPEGPQGIQGEAGAPGPAGLVWQGIYDPATTYFPDDVVTFAGTNGKVSAFFCTTQTTGNAPPNDVDTPNTWWAFLAQEGAQGPQGVQGIQGIQGIQGLTGANGTNGSNGTNGTNGADGSVWRDGVGVPSNSLGANGDYYLNTSNSDVYRKTTGTYSLATNIKGANGTNGTNGSNGSNGATGATGPAGPEASPYLLPVAAGGGTTFRETLPRRLASQASTVPSDTRVGGTAVVFTAGEVVTGVTLYRIAALSGGSASRVIIGTISGNFLTILAMSANDTSATWAANTSKRYTMTTPWVCPATGVYYVSYAVAATAVGTIMGVTPAAAALYGFPAPMLGHHSAAGIASSANIAAMTVSATLDVSGNAQQLLVYASID